MSSLRQSGRLAASLLTGMMAAGVFLSGSAQAQVQIPFTKKYFPLDHTVPPGKAGAWMLQTRPDLARDRGYFQPVRVELPEAAKVTFYAGSPDPALSLPSPASAALLVGRCYRLKISEITGFPGVELYPTIELLDRLHPPSGKGANYPIPVTLAAEEINAVLEGRLVTKVVYLEQPDSAYVGPAGEAVRNLRADPRQNALAIADQHGRPVAIIRIGGRVAAPQGRVEDPDFYGSGAPVRQIQVHPVE